MELGSDGHSSQQINNRIIPPEPMKPLFALPFLASAFALMPISADAAVITLLNADFQASGNDTDPTNWVVTNTAGVYVWANPGGSGGVPAGVNVLAMNSSTGAIQQSFSNSEAVGETYGSYTIGFDYGKRANTATSTFTFNFSLINVTDDVVLGTSTFTLPTAAATADTYTALGTNSVIINYDNTNPDYAGDTLALRISATQTGSTTFTNTAWVDNITVNAIPEPSAALLGGLGFLALLRRRR